MVCDWWKCANFEDCKARHIDFEYPPCACCPQFDMCSVCADYIQCADLVRKFLPNMFRRLVREIRLGDDTQHTEQYIRRNTLNGRKRK